MSRKLAESGACESCPRLLDCDTDGSSLCRKELRSALSAYDALDAAPATKSETEPKP